MTQSRAEIQKRSDEKRGLKPVGLKLPIETVELLKSLANESGKSQATVITEALQLLSNSLKK